MAACANCRISPQLLEHAQIPQLRPLYPYAVLPLATRVAGPSVLSWRRLPHARSCPSCSTRPDTCLAFLAYRAFGRITLCGWGPHASVAG